MEEPWQREGTIAFFIDRVADGWRENRERYDLPILRVNRFEVAACKTEAGFLEVRLYGLMPMVVHLRGPLPPGPDLLHVMLIWRSGAVQLFLDGDPVDLVQMPDADAAVPRRDN